MSADTIITAILTGEADENIQGIYEAYRERARLLRAQQGTINRLTITPGTRVRLVRIKPKHLIGRVGVVVKSNGNRSTRIPVEFDPPIPGFANPVRVPATSVEPV